MVLDWRWRTHWTSTCPLGCEARWWAGDDLRMHDNFGVGTWYKVEGRMDMHPYECILQHVLWSTIQNHNMGPSSLVFQYDNEPTHTSKIVQERLASQPFQLRQWPTQSLDLNPIEQLWALL